MYIDLFSDILFFFFFLLQKTISTSRDYLIGAITAKTDVEKKEMLIKYEAYFFSFPPFYSTLFILNLSKYWLLIKHLVL